MEEYLGRHIIAEYRKCDREKIKNKKEVERIMVEAAKRAKVTIVEKCFHQFSPYGVSGVVVIAESYLAIHTWPEYGYSAVDFFTCNHNIEIKNAIEYLKNEFKTETVEIKEIRRGEISKLGI